jgi:hypothetical protein
MADIALTRIRHGNEDGTIVDIPEGEKIEGLDEETVKALREQGAIGSPPTDHPVYAEERQDLLDQIRKLQDDLTKATSGADLVPQKDSTAKPVGNAETPKSTTPASTTPATPAK